MTILQALNRYYDRMAARGEAEERGWSREKFGFCVVLEPDGTAIDIQDLRDLGGKKPALRLYPVPAGVKRTVGIAPNFLWDKTAYVLGRTAGEGKRTAQEHEAFKALHAERLEGTTDEGLLALRSFLKSWAPDQLEALPRFTLDMLDANIMFRLEGDRNYLHERAAARNLVSTAATSIEAADNIHCLITGDYGPVQRLHPTIKGVEGAQSSGAALVSFNLDAFTSYSKAQGDNAPTSEVAAFRYGAALNRMLDRDSPNRIARPIGDATVVFWADASELEAAAAADEAWGAWNQTDDITDAAEARKIAEGLEAVAQGRAAPKLDPEVVAGIRFHILGLSPNAARLSVRFWETGRFGDFARRLQSHYEDLRIDPPPFGWGAAPSVNRILVRTTAQGGEFKNIPHQLAGEVMRAVLTGAPYPQTLLSAVLIRLRAGDSPASGWHAAVIKAVLNRNQRSKFGDAYHQDKEGVTPVALKREHDNPGYQLGRLFAVYELAQRAALGKVNATIRDRYFGAASATPASIFPLIIRGGQSHLAKVRKEKPGWATLMERELEEISGHFDPQDGGTFPRSLGLVDQGEFAIGYYHQRATKLKNDKGEQLSLSDDETADEGEGE